jgi:hypothetical protein
MKSIEDFGVMSSAWSQMWLIRVERCEIREGLEYDSLL